MVRFYVEVNQLVHKNNVVWISKKFTIAPRTKASPHGMRRNMCSISPLPLDILLNKLFASTGACGITLPWLCLASQHLIQDVSRERRHASELAYSRIIGKAIKVKTHSINTSDSSEIRFNRVVLDTRVALAGARLAGHCSTYLSEGC